MKTEMHPIGCACQQCKPTLRDSNPSGRAETGNLVLMENRINALEEKIDGNDTLTGCLNDLHNMIDIRITKLEEQAEGLHNRIDYLETLRNNYLKEQMWLKNTL